VKSTDASFLEALGWHLEPFRRPRLEHGFVPVQMYVTEDDKARDERPYSLFRGGELVHASPHLAAMLTFALWDIHAYVPKNIRDFLVMHAGSVTGNGGSVLLPAEPEVGKSSTVAAMLQRGFRYLSDELGVIDPVSGHAYPFPKRIALQKSSTVGAQLEESTERHPLTLALQDRYFAPEELGSSVGPAGPVRWLGFLSENRQGLPRLRGISKAEAVERMAKNAFNLDVYGDRGVILLSRVASEAEPFVIEGGNVEARADLLADRFLR
jgi:hypothetical protein